MSQMPEPNDIYLHDEQRNLWLTLDDGELFSLCRHENYIASGRGGQKRNKTSNAVRLTHLPTCIVVSDCSTRSQHDNRASALFKLRCELAMRVRCDSSPIISIDTSIKNPRYPLWLAMVMDHLVSAEYDLKVAAESLNVSRTRLLKLIARDTVFWQFMNHCRLMVHLPPLHP